MARPQPPRIPGLIDAHCHLDYPPMADDIAAALERGHAAGVEQFVHVGCSRKSHARALALVEAHDVVFAAVGIHPHEAKTTDPQALAEIEQMAAHPKVVAVGETGLDYYYNHSTPEQQRQSLADHVLLARRLNMPLVLHIRDAHEEALDIVTRTGPRPELPGMVHCFSGTEDEAKAWLDQGFMISFSGIATFPKAASVLAAAQQCPADRIMLETDAPYLSPVPVRGPKNHPANVAFTCAHLAKARGQDPVELAAQATRNTRALLDLPRVSPPA